jgi:CheY-like chemotaxis protein
VHKPVMIVEDNHDVQEVLCIILENEGYQVVTAANGAQALEKLQQVQPAVVLLDYMMPVMNGATFIHELEARGLRDEMHIVLLTASGDAYRRAREMRVDASLDKPFDVDRLLNMVAAWAE